MAEGTFAIGGRADVPANMVYVDNVVDAIAMAIDAPDTRGGSAYLVTDPDPCTLLEFYERFARAADLRVRIVDVPTDDRANSRRTGLAGRWMSGLRTIATSAELRAIVRRVLETDPIGTLPRWLWNLSPSVQQSLLTRFGVDAAVIYRPGPPAGVAADLVYRGERSRVSSARARAELGFCAPVPPARATALTVQWARSARLLPAETPRLVRL
jgi:nucleoside-diphosphate-sugar epimerase